MELYAIDQNVKILMSITLSVIAISLFLLFKTKFRKTIMIYMILSTIGDIFMTNFIWINQMVNLFIGAGSFIAAHIVIGIEYIKYSKENNLQYINKGFWGGLSVVILSIILVTILAFTVPAKENQSVLLYFLVLIYAVIIGFNICGNFSYAFNRKGNQYVLPIAIVVFFITDIWIFLKMLNIYAILNQYFVWYFYPFAQFFIILFIEPFKKEKVE